MSKKNAPAGTTLRFRTRNYKHETRLDPGSPRWIVNYTDAMWETLCAGIAANDFTGLVFYPGLHPFEFILDHSAYPEAATQPAEQNAATRNALNRGLAIAHKHGLKTFMQHYTTHYTEPLAKSLGLPTTGRLADTDHPEIDRYLRWIYREIFRQCPDLDGLYFNYESGSNAWPMMIRTAIAEFNAMEKKPIIVHRLWNMNDVEGVRAMIKAYKGRTILGHKISDTNDTYYLPKADSRVVEWKKRLGFNQEFMFLVGPCHNCGTNLQGNMWADYDFVQGMLADAQKKGADSFSFHTVHEFFAPDAPDATKVYNEREMLLSRLNVLHMDAVVDYVHGVKKTRAQRAARMAARMGVPAEAGNALLEVIEQSGRCIILTFQQFCYGSAYDGFLNPGRYSFVQDPFYYYPASEMNNQGSRAVWSPVRCDTSWIEKRMDFKVAPDNMYQFIIDAANPKKRKAVLHPAKIAAQMKSSIDRSLKALAEYRRLAGDPAAGLVEPEMQRNLIEGEYVRHEILAALQIYGVYFATGKAGVIARLKKGLEELKSAGTALNAPEEYLGTVKRSLMINMAPQREIDLVTEALSIIATTPFPFAAFREYVASRREYNETRRVCRAARRHNKRTMAWAEKQHRAAIRRARASLEHLRDEKWCAFADNVVSWLVFLETQLAQMTPPATVAGREPGDWLSTIWDHAFRAGENCIEDFVSFFRPIPAALESQIRLRVWRTDDAVAVTMREDGVDPAQRRAQWDRYLTEGSSSFVERVYFDVEGKGKSRVMFIVWPKGSSVSRGVEPNMPVKTEYREEPSAYETTAYFPFEVLGKRPKKGDLWRFNVTANPAIKRNVCFTWAPQYDANGGNPCLFGKLRFE